jgi:hypothetical protein
MTSIYTTLKDLYDKNYVIVLHTTDWKTLDQLSLTLTRLDMFNLVVPIKTLAYKPARCMKCIACCEFFCYDIHSKYDYGVEDNGDDEHYHLECPNCRNDYIWEIHHDCTETRVFHSKNTIVISNTLERKGYNARGGRNVGVLTTDELQEKLQQANMYVMKDVEVFNTSRLKRKKHYLDLITQLCNKQHYLR